MEIYVSTDVETDGPIPGPHSMISFASAAFSPDKELIATYTVNIEPLADSSPHPDTLLFWQDNKDAYEATLVNQLPAITAMTDYLHWLESLPGTPIFMSYPITFDFLFVYWYLIKFTGRCPFSHSGIDIKTYAMALLGTDYRNSGKTKMPEYWFDNSPHTHVALDDAIEQGRLFCNMRNERMKNMNFPWKQK